MSKRIDELWGQALDRAVPDTYSSLSWTQIEKIKAVFAELIVRECTNRVNQYINDCGEVASLPDYVLESHFGVEK